MGVQQGHTNNIEDLQRALEGLTEATAQEREDNAAARAHNEVLQAAVNALQFQMASVGQGGPTSCEPRRSEERRLPYIATLSSRYWAVASVNTSSAR